MAQRLALITGITGQDGSYLAELLLEKGYHVHGIYRRSSTNNNLWRIEHLMQHPQLTLHHGDLLDTSSVQNAISKLWSSAVDSSATLEIYNLAAQSHVQRSFEMPEYTIQVDGAAVLGMLEWIRGRPAEERSRIRFYQASTSELFGKVQEVPQRETTPFYPRSPYGVAKLYAFWIVKNYREAYGIYATNGILFNHESPRRGEDFVTQKIVKNVVRICRGGVDAEPMQIGNLDAQRDWGHAKDYVEGMWRILQHPSADDWVLSSNETHSVREFIERAFAHFGRKIQWRNEVGGYEQGICPETRRVLVQVNASFFRPAEVDLLLGDSTRARTELGWSPAYSFTALVDDMMAAEELKAGR
jgi:GDPmannose 4,6-dehydratase